MSERRISHRIVAAGLLPLIGAGALAGCSGNDQKKVSWEVGVVCPENSGSVNIENVKTVYDQSYVDISCTSNGSKVAPDSVEITKGPGTVIDNGSNHQTVYIDARYSDEFMVGGDPSMETAINHEKNKATLIIKDVREVTAARTTQPNPQ